MLTGKFVDVNNICFDEMVECWPQSSTPAIFRTRTSPTLCDKVRQLLTTGHWFSPSTPVSSTNNTNRHDIHEILLKVALNTIQPSKAINIDMSEGMDQLLMVTDKVWEMVL